MALANIAKVDAVAAAAIAKINGLVFTTAAGAFLLDTYTGAAAGYSTRRLATSATNLMRIREDAGDTETDIGYDSNNELDTAAIATHCGTANGYVVTWYDQAGSNNATQGTEASQPQIYNGTAVITENGKPALSTDGTGDYLNFNAITFASDFCFVNVQTWHITDIAYGGDSGHFAGYGYLPNKTRWRLNGNTSDFNFAGVDGKQYLGFANRASNSMQVHFSGDDGGTLTNTGTAIWDKIMAGNGTSLWLDGFSQELIFWQTDQSSNRAGIEENINSDYLIYQPTDAPTSGLLADYTGAAAAYSVRQLSDKAVIALRVRRDSDDEEINIGFDANGDLDSQAISDFCSTANGYVTRWWDQSTEGNHADQATDTSQPQIYDGTAVITENGKPAVEFASDYIATPAFSTPISQPTTYFITVNKTNHSGYLFERSAGTGRQAQGDSTWVFAGSVANGFYPTADLGSQRLFTALFDGASSISRMNSVATGSGNPGTQGQGGLQIGRPTQSLTGKVQEFIIYGADQTSNFTGIETDINSEYLIYQPTDAPTSGLLATYTGAAAAYSVRQLANTAVMSMRVRRDSDDVEQNFGFDSNGDLDTAGIASFCGTANGYVTRWWDQSTNGNHADQATDTSQPQIYDGTAVITENGKPALSKNSSGSGVLSTSAVSGSTTISIFNVAVLGDTGNRVAQLGNVIHAGGFMYQGGILNFTSTNVNQVLTSLLFKSTDEAYLDGSQVASGNAGTSSAGSGVIGGQSASLRVIDSMQEIVFWNADQSSNRTGIETNINDHFDIYT